MARTAKAPDGADIESGGTARRSYNVTPDFEEVLARVTQLIPEARGNKSAALRWMAATIDPMLERLAMGLRPEDVMGATTMQAGDLAAEFAATGDVYRLGYAIGAYEAAGGKPTPAVLDNCVMEPGRSLAIHLAKHRGRMAEVPLVVEVLATLRPGGLPEHASDAQQCEWQLGYYHGRARKYHKPA